MGNDNTVYEATDPSSYIVVLGVGWMDGTFVATHVYSSSIVSLPFVELLAVRRGLVSIPRASLHPSPP